MIMGSPAMMALAVAAPFVAVLFILFAPRRLTEVWGFIAAGIAALACASLLPAVLGGAVPEQHLLTLMPGMELVFRADALGLTFALLASGLWIITGVYSGGYARADNLKHRPRYFAAFAASVGAALGVAFAGNLLTFFIFYETLTLSTYPLVVHKESEKAYAAGRRYLLFALGSGLAMLTAIAWTWQITGSLDFTPGGFLAGQVAGPQLAVLFTLFILGVSVKAAVMPLHSWLPAAMVAPTPVSALLHAVAVVKAGVFGVMRVIGFVFGPAALADFGGDEILAGLAAATIVIGSLIALRQDNLKRRLAYSTVVHLSYIVLGAALLTPYGLVGSTMHMVNHGLAKITLFFCAGAIYVTTHRENISQLTGLGRQMPWTFGAFTVGSLALVGIPGLSGFVGKFFLARGAIQGDDVIALAIMLGASLLTASYLLPIVRIAFFPGLTPEGEAYPTHRAEAPRSMLVPLLVTSVLVVIFGVLPYAIGTQYELADLVAERVFSAARFVGDGAAPLVVEGAAGLGGGGMP
ncbi:MAG TPA: proton-conducting transporter membrane subunit [Longimicrobiales bacterium]|nr:proton-conducting transporter membrane subunit [Longimicrobiales bacterium]